MATIVIFLPLLACAAVMGLMMKMMMRPGQEDSSSSSPAADPARQQELAQLRAEAAILRAERRSPR